MAIFPQMGYGADPSDDTRIALLKTLEYLNLTYGIVASPFPEGTLALSSDDTRRAAIKINAAIVAGQGGGGSTEGTAQVVAAPATVSDFSGLPGGIAPTGDTVYFAPRNTSTLWTIAGGDAQWTVIDKNNP